jgi:hypothetical protein
MRPAAIRGKVKEMAFLFNDARKDRRGTLCNNAIKFNN